MNAEYILWINIIALICISILVWVMFLHLETRELVSAGDPNLDQMADTFIALVKNKMS